MSRQGLLQEAWAPEHAEMIYNESVSDACPGEITQQPAAAPSMDRQPLPTNWSPVDYPSRLMFLIECLQQTTYGDLLVSTAVADWKMAWLSRWAPFSRKLVLAQPMIGVYLFLVSMASLVNGPGPMTVTLYFLAAFPAFAAALTRVAHTHSLHLLVGLPLEAAWSRALVFPAKLKPANALVTWSPAAFEQARKHKWLSPLVQDQTTVKYLAVTAGWEDRARWNEWHSWRVGTGLDLEYASFVFSMWCCFPYTPFVSFLPWLAVFMGWSTLVFLAATKRMCGREGSRRCFSCVTLTFPSYVRAITEARLDAALARAAEERTRAPSKGYGAV